MHLSPSELFKKFPFLQKFQNQDWISENSLRPNLDPKEIPVHCALIMIKELKEFLEKTKFQNGYEVYLSTKIRLAQMEDLLLYFCEDTNYLKSKKGTNL